MARKVPVDSTYGFIFTTSDAAGGAIAPSDAFEAADLKIYKNGGATEKATTNGITMTSPFDAITGVHRVSIDTSNDTGDAGFWAIGAQYDVVLDPDTETVDSQTIASILSTFIITDGAEFYPDGFVHVDTVNGTAGTVIGTNGTPGYPVDSMADARSIAEAMNMRRIMIHGQSTVTLASAYDGYEIVGGGQAYVDLASQTLTDCVLRNLTLDCNATFDDGWVEGCEVIIADFDGEVTFDSCWMRATQLPFGAGSNDRCRFLNCAFVGSSGGTVDIVSTSTAAALVISLSNCWGDVEISAIDRSTDVVEVYGGGSITLASDCTDGAITVGGIWDLTDSSAGSTVTRSGQIQPDNVLREISTEPTGAPVLGTDTLRSVLEWVAHFHINEINQTSSQVAVRDAGDTTDIATATYSNNGTTVVRGKFS